MPRIYSVKHNRSERFFPDQSKAMAEACNLGDGVIWSYEPLSIPQKELQVLMLNGQRWWYACDQIIVTKDVA